MYVQKGKLDISMNENYRILVIASNAHGAQHYAEHEEIKTQKILIFTYVSDVICTLLARKKMSIE
jgi:hypothetical protein